MSSSLGAESSRSGLTAMSGLSISAEGRRPRPAALRCRTATAGPALSVRDGDRRDTLSVLSLQQDFSLLCPLTFLPLRS
eukprot:scaffold96198_cov69-Phaeocystis_antarctica.AAC.7